MLMQSAARTVSRLGLWRPLDVAFRWSGVLCLNYHRIGDGGRSLFDRELWSADADLFDQQVRLLKADFDIVTPDDIPDVPLTPRHRFILLTFDDGYRDNYELALPILTRHGVAATFFVTTGFIDHPRLTWWDEIAWMVRSSERTGLEAGRGLAGAIEFDEPDRAHAVARLIAAYKTLPPSATDEYLEALASATGAGRADRSLAERMWMTWDMIRELRAAGMVIGGHTVTHPVLAHLTPEAQWREISECAGRLTSELGEPMRYFSYPVGQPTSFNQDTRACLQRAGVRWAFSYYGGYQRVEEWDALDVRRIAIERYVDAAWLRAIVTLPGVFGAER